MFDSHMSFTFFFALFCFPFPFEPFSGSSHGPFPASNFESSSFCIFRSRNFESCQTFLKVALLGTLIDSYTNFAGSVAMVLLRYLLIR